MLLTFLVLSASASQPLGDPPTYEVIDLGGSAWGLAFGADVNDHRGVVGALDTGPSAAEGGRRAVLWRPDGTWVNLTPGDHVQSSTASAINNSSEIVGNLNTNDGSPQGGFRWKSEELQVLPSVFQQTARCIDPRGRIAGHAHTPNFHFQPTIWEEDLSYQQLGTFGGTSGSAQDLDGWGRAVGSSTLAIGSNQTRAFLWEDGQLDDLGTLPGHSSSFATGINSLGHVVGVSGIEPFLIERGFLWTPGAGMVDLGHLGFDPRSQADDLNDAGTVVGTSRRADGEIAVVWLGGVIHELNDLIDPSSGWTLRTALGINERGDIVGYGNLGPGASRAYLAIRRDGGNLTTIEPRPGLAGATNRVEVLGATPGGRVILAVGIETGQAQVPGCDQVQLRVSEPRLRSTLADSDGRAVFELSLSPMTGGQHLLFQSADVESCRTSNLVVQRID